MRMRNSMIVLVGFLLAGCVVSEQQQRTPQAAEETSSSASADRLEAGTSSRVSTMSKELVDPIPQVQSRVTKKPFGIHVTPASSPVSPERFSGYHTGLDVETFPNEQDADVPISAICTGTVRFTGWVKGYGGLMIQQCTYQDQEVTVLYGHLNMDSIAVRAGTDLTAGAQIGVLGTAYSTQTDGERKHLHLAIHKGSGFDYRGYVSTKQELDQWINPFQF